MAKRSDSIPVNSTETIVGPGVTLRGDLRSDGDIIIEGRLEGKIVTEGDLTIGVNAEVFGPVQAVNLSIAGKIEGQLTAGGEISIESTGQVLGDISCRTLAIQSGGLLQGRSNMAAPHQRHAAHEDIAPERSLEP